MFFVKVLYLQCFVFKQDEKRETKITIIRFATMAMDVLVACMSGVKLNF